MANDAKGAAAGDAAGNGEGSGSKPDAYLEPIRKQLEGIQSLMGRFGERLGNLDKRVGQASPRTSVQGDFGYRGDATEIDPRDARMEQIERDLEESRRERELDRFARLSGVGSNDWTEIVARLQADERQFQRFNRKGDLDYFASYEAAWQTIQLERFRAAGGRAEEQRNENDAQQEALKRKGAVTGAAASGSEGNKPREYSAAEIARMSSAEYLEKVLKPAGGVDPNDPPSTNPYGM